VKTKVIASECCKYKGTGIREKQKKLIKKKNKQFSTHSLLSEPLCIIFRIILELQNHWEGEAAEQALRAAAKQMSRKVLVALAGSSAFPSYYSVYSASIAIPDVAIVCDSL
jgi:hypothetical protein